MSACKTLPSAGSAVSSLRCSVSPNASLMAAADWFGSMEGVRVKSVSKEEAVRTVVCGRPEDVRIDAMARDDEVRAIVRIISCFSFVCHMISKSRSV
jgi:hypothetical protein